MPPVKDTTHALRSDDAIKELPAMLRGHVDANARYAVAGWAADTDDLTARVDIVIFVGGREYGRARADLPRRDLRELGTYGDGQHGFRYSFDPPLSILDSYDISVRFALDGEPLSNGSFRLEAQRDIASTRLRPLVITTSGQPGFADLMQGLASDPGVVVAEARSYGVRLLSYYAQALDVLTRPHPPGLVLGNLADDYNNHIIGPNPHYSDQYDAVFPRSRQLYDFFLHRPQAALCTAFSTIVDEFYATLAAHQGKPEVRYFAEQCDLFTVTASFARLAFPNMREIVLLQDPRDAYCGYRALWSVSPAQALETLNRVRDRTVQRHSEGLPNTWFLRTEDLRARPAETMAEIRRFLGLTPNPEVSPDAATTADQAALGIGRWKTELDATEIAFFEREFGTYLRLFGYELTVSTET
jgi:hypothetical protein